jgi:chemotaxis protein CheD
MKQGNPFEIENKKIITIHSGEYYVTKDPDVVIYTLLDSCIAVCLYDQVTGIGGMNHFMLPESVEFQLANCGHFGLQSLEIMMNHLQSEGAVLQNMKAKVFGGSNMADFHNRENDVALANIQFTLKYLESKRIPIMARELGGLYGRKIYYFLNDYSVYVQRLIKEGIHQDVSEQSQYR